MVEWTPKRSFPPEARAALPNVDPDFLLDDV